MIGRRSGTATGELKQQAGRVTGKASVSDDAQGMFPSSFDVRFDTALLKTGDSLPASTARKGGPAANVKPSVTGVFKGNGKDAKLAYVSAQWREPFNDKCCLNYVIQMTTTIKVTYDMTVDQHLHAVHTVATAVVTAARYTIGHETQSEASADASFQGLGQIVSWPAKTTAN